MIVKDVMSREVVRVAPESKLHAIAVFMRDGDLGSVPVSEGDKLIGMVTDRDIVVRGLAGAPSSTALTARDVMSPNIKYCFEDQTVEEVLENMGTEKIRRLPVLSREKRLVGIVSLGDLAKKTSTSEAGEALEEISQG